MSTRIASLIAFPLASLFAAGALAAAVVGQPAPAFSVKDIAGKTVSLADFKGKTVVLEWHNFGCPFVQKHYNSGNMQGMQKNFSGQVVWLAVNSTEPGHQDYVKPAAIRKKLNEMGAVPAAYLMDESGEMGKAYGVEVLLRKTRGRLTGWVSYTLYRTLRDFEAINEGATYPARHDRIHDLAFVGMYELTPRWQLSATWVFNTGDAATFPSGTYDFEGKRVPYYTERNGYRFPSYHRLDLGATFIARKTKRYESSWNFSVYNTYGRQNVYAISFAAKDDNPEQNEATQIALFRWIPSATWNFKF